MKRMILKVLLIASLYALTPNLSTVKALPNQYWVGSALSGAYSGDAKTPSANIEVQIDVQPKVLNLESGGVYSVFVTFPEKYDYGKKVGDIGGETIIMQFSTQKLDVKGFESDDEVLLVAQGTLIDGTTFLGSMSGSYADGHIKIIRIIQPYPTDP